MTEGVRVGSEVLVKLGNLTGREKVGGSQRIPLLTFYVRARILFIFPF